MIEIQKYQPCSADLRPWSVSKYSRICKNLKHSRNLTWKYYTYKAIKVSYKHEIKKNKAYD